MTLPASGPLTFSDIQTEFGGSNPIGLNEYYAGGGLVPAGTSGTYGAVPSSGQISVQNFYGTSQFIPVYIEDLFSTFLYIGTGANQTITNNINLSGKGGLVWIKSRTGGTNHMLWDTVSTASLSSNTTDASGNSGTFITGTSTTGFSINVNSRVSQLDYNFASWTFREQPKFFDVVTYTGNGVTTGRTIAHSLNSAVGAVFVKCTSNASDWPMWHNTFTGVQGMYLNTTNSKTFNTFESKFGNGTTVVAPTSSVFTVGIDLNASGFTYVAYLFAHNAGGFGVTGTDNVVSCGSFTTDGSGNATVSLGYEPQWLLIKSVTFGSWWITDTMRGMSVASGDNVKALFANTSGAESNANEARPNATGFTVGPSGNLSSSDTFIYIAIRRGPMKVPTSGTSVFTPATRTGTGAADTVTSAGFPIDLIFSGDRSVGRGFGWDDRLSGAKQSLRSWTSAGYTSDTEGVTGFDSMTGMSLGDGSTFGGSYNVSGETYVYEMLRRAPSFFDVVRYKGTGVAGLTVTHNLTVVPEFMIVKGISIAEEWNVYYGDNTKYIVLNQSSNAETATTRWNDTSPTSSVFSLGTSNWVNQSGSTYVAYLFATCAGVSKVGSYTGTGALQTINCGFSSGSRFVLIKRIDSTGGWYTYDSARGISSGNDPYLFLNSTATEVTGTNYVDTTSVGFQVTAAAPAELNASGGTYIFLAIA